MMIKLQLAGKSNEFEKCIPYNVSYIIHINKAKVFCHINF
jgi:hypothetical protein